jgi:hypothetical protein
MMFVPTFVIRMRRTTDPGVTSFRSFYSDINSVTSSVKKKIL